MPATTANSTGLRKWPMATFSEAQVRRGSLTCWFAAQCLARLCVHRGCIAPALASCKLEVEPLFVVPSFVSGRQSDICQDDIDGAVSQDEPLRL